MAHKRGWALTTYESWDDPPSSTGGGGGWFTRFFQLQQLMISSGSFAWISIPQACRRVACCCGYVFWKKLLRVHVDTHTILGDFILQPSKFKGFYYMTMFLFFFDHLGFFAPSFRPPTSMRGPAVFSEAGKRCARFHPQSPYIEDGPPIFNRWSMGILVMGKKKPLLLGWWSSPFFLEIMGV